MQLKNTYSSREVAALTGLTARQLQWWDAGGCSCRRLHRSATAAGGFTERRYTPVDLFELMVLADLRRQGFGGALRLLLDTLRQRSACGCSTRRRRRVAHAADRRQRDLRANGDGEFYNLLETPAQPLLVVGDGTANARDYGELRAGAQEQAAEASSEGWTKKG